MKIGQARTWVSDAPPVRAGETATNATVYYGGAVPGDVFWAHLALGGEGAVVHRKHGLVHLFRTGLHNSGLEGHWHDCTYHFVDRIEHDTR